MKMPAATIVGGHFHVRSRITSDEVTTRRPNPRSAARPCASPAYPAARWSSSHAGVQRLVLLPVGPQVGRIGPEADRQPRRVGDAQRGGLGDHRPYDVHAQHVGLDLHAQVVIGDTAVDLQHLKAHTGIGFHRVHHIAALVADRLQRRAGHVRVGVEPRQAHDRAAGIGSPVWGEQPGERRNEIHPAVVGDLAGQRFALRGAADDAQLVAQPLHRRAGHRYRTLKCVYGFGVPELVAHGGQQAVARIARSSRRCSAAGNCRCRRCFSPPRPPDTPARPSPRAGHRGHR